MLRPTTNEFFGVTRPVSILPPRQSTPSPSRVVPQSDRPEYFTTADAAQGVSYSEKRFIPVGGGKGFRVPQAQQTIMASERGRYEEALDTQEASKQIKIQRSDIDSPPNDSPSDPSRSPGRGDRYVAFAQRFNEGVDRVHSRFGLEQSGDSIRYSDLGPRRFAQESVKHLLRTPGEMTGLAVAAGARTVGAIDITLTQRPSKSTAAFVASPLPEIGKGLARSAAEGRASLYSVVSTATKPSKPLSFDIYKLLSNQEKRRQATSFRIPPTDSSFDPRNVGGALNIASAVAGAGLIKQGAIKLYDISGTSRMRSIFRNIEQRSTQKGKVWNPDYDVPDNARLFDQLVLEDRSASRAVRDRIALRSSIPRTSDILPGGQRQLVPRIPGSTTVQATDLKPSAISFNDPSVRQIWDYSSNYPRRARIAVKEVPKAPATGTQAQLIDAEIIVQTPRGNVAAYNSPFTDRFLDYSSTLPSPRRYPSQRMFQDKRGQLLQSDFLDAPMSQFKLYKSSFRAPSLSPGRVGGAYNLERGMLAGASFRSITDAGSKITPKSSGLMMNDLKLRSRLFDSTTPVITDATTPKTTPRLFGGTVPMIGQTPKMKLKTPQLLDPALVEPPTKKPFGPGGIGRSGKFRPKLVLPFPKSRGELFGRRAAPSAIGSRYSPSVVASVLGQRGKRPDILTGLEVRPI